MGTNVYIYSNDSNNIIWGMNKMNQDITTLLKKVCCYVG